MKRSLSFIQRIGPVLLVLAAVSGLYHLAARYPLQRDVTQNALNSLEPGSVDALRQLQGPVSITVYAQEQDAQLGDIRKFVREFVALYQRYKSDISLSFVDPVKQPEAMRKAAIQGNGEMVIEFEGRREHLTTLNEQTLSSALLRLAHSKEQLLMYLTGHGERKLDGSANHDLGEFGRRLQQNGYRIAGMNLAQVQDVPDNASVLVLTQPQFKIGSGEMAKLQRYIERGGNLLWLLDAEPLRGLDPLAERLGIDLSPGIVIDPAAQQMDAPANWALGTGYPPHPVTRDFDLVTVFPYARALALENSKEWQAHTLVEGAAQGWVSEHPTDKPRFDKNRDIPGPVDLALALQRDVAGHEQRIVVVGSGGFLANEERLITLQPHAAKDAKIILSKRQLSLLSVTLLIVLPLLFVAVGGWLWRRKHS